jgi:hypothetical protein
MRVIIVFIVVCVVLVGLGMMFVDRNPEGNVVVTIDTNKMEKAADRVVDASKDLVHGAQNAVHRGDADNTTTSSTTTTTTTSKTTTAAPTDSTTTTQRSTTTSGGTSP